MLAGEFVRLLAAQATAQDVWALNRNELDVASNQQVRDAVFALKPDVVVNCAAFTAVDAAEQDPAAAFRVNAEGPRNLARALDDVGSGLLIQISTDYVFGGSGSAPYLENSAPSPLCVYGASKLQGESWVAETLPDRHLIARTAWLLGSSNRNFASFVLGRTEHRGEVRAAFDQFGSPSWSRDVAHRVLSIHVAMRQGGLSSRTVHVVNSGSASKLELALFIEGHLSIGASRVRSVALEDLRLPAPRPRDSSLLDTHASGLLGPMRPWREAVGDCVSELIPHGITNPENLN